MWCSTTSGLRVQQPRRDALTEAQRVDRALRVAHARHRHQHGAGQPRHLQRRGEVGQGAIARPDERSRIAPPRVAVDQPVGDGGQVDLAEPVRVDALGRPDPGVDGAGPAPTAGARRPGPRPQPAGRCRDAGTAHRAARRPGHRAARSRSRRAQRRRAARAQSSEQPDHGQAGHPSSPSTVSANRSASAYGHECVAPGTTTSRPP